MEHINSTPDKGEDDCGKKHYCNAFIYDPELNDFKIVQKEVTYDDEIVTEMPTTTIEDW